MRDEEKARDGVMNFDTMECVLSVLETHFEVGDLRTHTCQPRCWVTLKKTHFISPRTIE